MTLSVSSREARSQLTLVSVEHVTVRDRHIPINPAGGVVSSFNRLHTTNGGEPGAATSQAIPGVLQRKPATVSDWVFADSRTPAGTWSAS